MRKRSVSFLSTMIAIILTVLLSVSAFALEPEELTSATVYDRDGRVVTVGIEPGTSTWSALADGQGFTIYTGLAPNQHGMWYCVAGRVKFDYSGFVEFQGENWYVENGKVATDFSGEKSDSQYVYTIDRGKLTNRRYTDEYSQKIEMAEKKKHKDTLEGALMFAAILVVAGLLGRRKARKNQAKRLEQETANRESEIKVQQEKKQKAREVYQNEVVDEGLAYKKGTFLTDREKRFYPHLKEVADKLGYTISMKPRLGDLVTGAHKQYSSQGGKELFKVQRKHVDFALFDPETQEIKLIIELDDTTHDRQDRVNRDVFVDNVLEGTGYRILHVYGPENLEEEILKKLNEA